MGVPITVKLNTVEIAAGWRFPMRRHLKYTPYAGGAVLFTKYSEKSDFEQPIDPSRSPATATRSWAASTRRSTNGSTPPLRCSTGMVPDALGKTGVSKLYEETDLGGFVAA